MNASVVARELIKIGLLHAPVNHQQENMGISRGSVIERELALFLIQTVCCVHELSQKQQKSFAFLVDL